MEKTWTRKEINGLLNTRPEAVERGIVRLYKWQTSAEKVGEHTSASNGRGFNVIWAQRGTYYARWVLSGRHLTGKHLASARKCCLIHSQQLTDFANGRMDAA